MKIITFITLLLLGTSAWAVGTQKIAGYAGETTGGVAFAFNKLGQKRKLDSKTPIYEGETLITSKTASSSVLFTDGTTIELNPSTQFRVEEFRYGEEVEKPSAVFRMLKGGFRFISGLVNKERGGSLSFKTSTATIGVRGSAGSFSADGTIEVYEGSFEVTPSSGGKPTTVSQGEAVNTASGPVKTRKMTKTDIKKKIAELKEKQSKIVHVVLTSNLIPKDKQARMFWVERLKEYLAVKLEKNTSDIKVTVDGDEDDDVYTLEKDKQDEQIQQLEHLLTLPTGGGSETSIKTKCTEGKVLVDDICVSSGGGTGVVTSSPATP